MTMSAEVNEQEQQLVNKLAEVETALTSNHPALQMHMVKLHAQLKQQPELVHVLKDEQIAVIIGGFMRLTNSALSTIAPAGGKGKSKKSFSAMDLGLDLG